MYHFRRAKSEWPSKFPPGHWALGLQKLPPVRFHSCAWVSQPTRPMQILAGRSGTGPYKNNAAAPLSRRRGGSETARKAFPWGKVAGRQARRMRGPAPITLPLRFPVGAAHWAARVCRPYGNRGMFQRMPSPEPNLSPTRPKGALPTDRSTAQRLPRTQRQR